MSRCQSVEVSFEKFTIPEPNSGCLLWIGPTVGGYGILRVPGSGRRQLKAHRVAWVRAYGEIPAALWVLHKCDNPPCVRPDHLFLGTHTDNMRDAIRKGRGTIGEGNGRAILTKDAVATIRASTLSGPVLAAMFGVQRSQIYKVKHGKAWKSVPR